MQMDTLNRIMQCSAVGTLYTVQYLLSFCNQRIDLLLLDNKVYMSCSHFFNELKSKMTLKNVFHLEFIYVCNF